MFSNIDKASKVTSQVSCTFHFHSSKHNHFFEICQNSIRTDSLKEQMNLVTCLFCLLWEILRVMSKRNNTFRLFPDWLLLVCCCEKKCLLTEKWPIKTIAHWHISFCLYLLGLLLLFFFFLVTFFLFFVWFLFFLFFSKQIFIILIFWFNLLL